MVTVITFVLTIWKFDVAKIDGLWGVATYFETIYFLDVFITIVFSTLAGTDEKFFQYIFYNITDDENVNIKCERFFDFFRFSIMHKRWSCFLVHYSHICHYIAASSFSNSSLLLQ